MIGESFAIIAVVLVMAAMGLRAKRKETAILALPFLFVPAAFLVGEALLYTLRSITDLPVSVLRLLAVLVGALAGMLLCAVLSKGFRSRKGGQVYLMFSFLVLIALAAAYYFQILG